VDEVRMYADGSWVEAAEGGRFEVVNPAKHISINLAE
jgi:hypothetical protein